MHRYAAPALIAAALLSALACGCGSNSKSADYLKSLQQSAIAGSLPPRIDPEVECPACAPEEAALAGRIVDAEHEIRSGCAGLPSAESNYRQIRNQLGDEDLPILPEYKQFTSGRMCTIARTYATCTDPANRRLEISDGNGPAAPLLTAIDQCRTVNRAAASEIIADVLHNEAQAISDAMMSGDFSRARGEVRIYQAMPSSNHERAENWLSAMGSEERAQKQAMVRARARAQQMVCNASVTYYDHDDKVGLIENSIPGMNLRAKYAPRKHGSEPTQSDQTPPRQKLDDLIALLANEANLSLEQSRKVLVAIYADAQQDPGYCAPRKISSR